MIDEIGARKLIAAVLKQAHEDYSKSKGCPQYCPYADSCNQSTYDSNECDARKFIHSAWCAALNESIGLDPETYIQACVKSRRLSSATYQYVKRQVCNYRVLVQTLDKIRQNIILAKGPENEIRGTDTSDPAGNMAIKIAQHKQMMEIGKTVNAINAVYHGLDGNKRVVMEEMWLNRYTSIGLAEKLCIGERSVWRWRQQIIYAVAFELKYL